MVDTYKITRTNNYDSDRPRKEFGVTIPSGGTATCSRAGDAIGMTVNTSGGIHVSDFSAYYPWKGMKRVVLWPKGDVFAYREDMREDGTSAFHATSLHTMVVIPKFWVKMEQSVYVGLRLWISPYPMKGYRLHPAFVRNGLPVDKIYVGAFEAYRDPLNTGPGLQSTANVTPTTNVSRANFRTYATSANITLDIPGCYGFNLMDVHTWSAIQLLYLVEYASLNSQVPSGSSSIGGLGYGLVNTGGVVKTGYTSAEGPGGADLGDASGNVQVSGSNYAMSYRGIENLWGNTATWIDGVNVQYPYRRVWLSMLTAPFSDLAVTYEYGYYRSYSVMTDAQGYITDMRPEYAAREGYQFLPYAVGGSSTTYYCDYYSTNANNVDRCLAVGGYYSSSTAGGIFAVHAVHGHGDVDVAYGTRVQYVPYDYTGFNKY